MDEVEQMNFTNQFKHMKGAPLHPEAYKLVSDKNENYPRY